MKYNKKMLFILPIFILIVAITSIIINAVREVPDYEISIVDLPSNGYNENWNVLKTARWISNDKVRLTLNIMNDSSSSSSPSIYIFVDTSNDITGYDLLKLKQNLIKFVDYKRSNSISIITPEIYQSILDSEGEDDEISIQPLYANDEENYQYLVDQIKNIKRSNISKYSVSAYLNYVNNYIMNYGFSSSNLIYYIGANLDDLNISRDTSDMNCPVVDSNFSDFQNIYNIIQYNLGDEIIDKYNLNNCNLSVADSYDLYDVMDKYSSFDRLFYEFKITDYIDNQYFTIENEKDINVSQGNFTLENSDVENAQIINWVIDDYSILGGKSETMTVDLKINNEYLNGDDFYPISLKTDISVNYFENEYSIDTFSSEVTPALTYNHNVIFNTNAPEDCSISDITTEVHKYGDEVELPSLSCSGYNFQGWEVNNYIDDDTFDRLDSSLSSSTYNRLLSLYPSSDFPPTLNKNSFMKILNYEDINKIDSYSFVMPGNDVVVEGMWSKVDIEKKAESKVVSKSTTNSLTDYAMLNIGSKVIFGDYCWEIVGTSENGGTKLIFDGGMDDDNTCPNNRSDSSIYKHTGFEPLTSKNLLESYYFGTDYRYDINSEKFYIDGTVASYDWSTDYENIIGKYSCLYGTSSLGCDELYYMDSYNSPSAAYVFPISKNVNYASIGKTKYNSEIDLFSSIGYMHGEAYPSDVQYTIRNIHLNGVANWSLRYYFSDGYDYDRTGDSYNLVNAHQLTSFDQLELLEGKYTIFSENEFETDNNIYYIVSASEDSISYLTLYNGHTEDYVSSTYYYSDTITNNNDDTYTLESPDSFETKNKAPRESLPGKYICQSMDSCSDPIYVYNVDEYNTVTASRPYIFGESVTYNESTNKYTLVNPIKILEWTTSEKFDQASNETKLDNYHHYACPNSTNSCSSVDYIYATNADSFAYISLSDGADIDEAMVEMLDNNQYDSTVKKIIDEWFRNNMLEYSEYLEDSVFCSSRKIVNYNAFNPNGGEFNVYPTFDTNSCTDIEDKFTVSNEHGNRKLKYPVGIFSKGNYATGFSYWVGNLNDTFDNKVSVVDESGNESYSNTFNEKDIRPVIVLSKNAKILNIPSEYDYYTVGSEYNPFLIDDGNTYIRK